MRDGLYTFVCEVNGIELGSGTKMGKKEAKHEAAKEAFCKLLKAAGHDTDPSSGKQRQVIIFSVVSHAGWPRQRENRELLLLLLLKF